MSPPTKMPATIWTIGHSTRPIEEFLGLLTAAGIQTIADVRSFPGSRKYPQYGKESLAATLANTRSAITGCRRWAAVVALRPIRPIRRGATPRFEAMPITCRARNSRRIDATADDGEQGANGNHVRGGGMVALSPFHDADALCVRGIEVVHILDAKHTKVHPMTAPARIVGGELTYAAAESG